MMKSKPQNTSFALVDNHHSGSTRHVHSKYHIVGYLLSGSLSIYQRETLRLERGAIFMLPAGSHFVGLHDCDSGRCEAVVAALTDQQIICALGNMTLSGDLRPSLPAAESSHAALTIEADESLETFFRGLRDYLTIGLFERCGDIEVMKINELLYLLCCRGQNPIAGQLALVGTPHHCALCRVVERNIYSRRSITALAEEANMSPSAFRAHFRALYGDSPHHWFVCRRLEMVRLRLMHSGEQIKKIAIEYGFVSASHMIRLFVKAYGTTPVNYRARYQRKGAKR